METTDPSSAWHWLILSGVVILLVGPPWKRR